MRLAFNYVNFVIEISWLTGTGATTIRIPTGRRILTLGKDSQSTPLPMGMLEIPPLLVTSIRIRKSTQTLDLEGRE